jgi:heat shock protein HtpX
MYKQIDSNKRKTWLLMFMFLVLVAFIGFIFGQATSLGYGIVVVAVVFAFLTNFFAYYYSDRVALAISGAKEITGTQNQELYRIVENLCIAGGLYMPALYVIDDTAPNAFAAGRDPQHAVIVVTKGLLEKLDKQEIEGVISHELSHIKDYDIRLMTIVVVLAGLVVLMSDLFLRWTFYSPRGYKRSSSGRGSGQAQAIILLIALVLALLAPICAQLIKFSISRKREFLADAEGAMMTRYPEGLARALEKISADQEPLEVANKATAHLYIANPLKGKGQENFLARMFSTHPPIEERIAALRAMEK